MLAELRRDTEARQALVAPGLRSTPLTTAWAWLTAPGLWLLATHRLTHDYERPRPRGWRQLGFLIAKAPVVVLGHLALVLTKSEIAPETPFEPGVVLADDGHIVAGALGVGSGTYIGEHVTIGMNLRPELKPTIGRDVWISPHCVVYGAISLGDGATLLPGSVLTRNVPAGGVVEGNPARVVGVRKDHTELRRALRAGLPTMAVATPEPAAT